MMGELLVQQLIRDTMEVKMEVIMVLGMNKQEEVVEEQVLLVKMRHL